MGGTPEDPEIEELRRLIAGRERVEIDRLRERLENPEHRTKDVSQVLPDAILLRTSQDQKIAKALGPTVEKAIESSIHRNRKAFVDVIFPVMGPAIRKAVASALQGMIQSFDKTLDASLSLRGLKWRFEALRTKKPFGEVVLLHTLLYRVEQFFLTHRASGLVLQHVTSKDVKAQDPDLVAGMLSAIRDFVRDSFSGNKDETLDTLGVGFDQTIWIEQSEDAALAAVIRGTPPAELRTTLRETLESIQNQHGDELKAFVGDTAAFEAARPDLEELLQSRLKPREKRDFPLFKVLAAIVLILLGALCFFSIRNHRRWTHYLGRLKEAPGIQLMSGEKRSGMYHLYGLKDPLSADPIELAKEAKLKPEKFAFHWESYASTNPQVVLRRAERALAPPGTVDFDFQDETLRIAGSAPHSWVATMRDAARSIPGISKVDDSRLIDSDALAFEELKKKIEARAFLFKYSTAYLVEGQEAEFRAFLDELEAVIPAAERLGADIEVEIQGHSDALGTAEGNLLVSRARAESVLALVLKEGLPAKYFRTSALGSREPAREEKTPQDRELNRRVSFRVTSS